MGNKGFVFYEIALKYGTAFSIYIRCSVDVAMFVSMG
jgi:hypothetical protein